MYSIFDCLKFNHDQSSFKLTHTKSLNRSSTIIKLICTILIYPNLFKPIQIEINHKKYPLQY